MSAARTSDGAKRSGGRARLILRLLGPLLLIVILWRLDAARTLPAVLRGATLAPLGVTLLLGIFPLHFKVLRWRALLSARGFNYPLSKAYVAVTASIYLGMLTPGRVGDVVRVQYVRRDLDMPYAEGLAVTLMDRFCDLYVLVGFVAVGAWHLSSVMSGNIGMAVAGVTALALAGPALLLSPGVAERVFGVAYRRLAKTPSDDGLERFLEALRGQLGAKLVWALCLSLLAFSVNYLQGWFIAQALNIELTLLDVASLLAVTSLLGLLPISISGLGVRELFLALVFPVIGLSAAQGVAFGLLVFVCLYLVYVLAGFVAWQLRPPPL
jgi:uncharacterized protein (TIRG00374 family)